MTYSRSLVNYHDAIHCWCLCINVWVSDVVLETSLGFVVSAGSWSLFGPRLSLPLYHRSQNTFSFNSYVKWCKEPNLYTTLLHILQSHATKLVLPHSLEELGLGLDTLQSWQCLGLSLGGFDCNTGIGRRGKVAHSSKCVTQLCDAAWAADWEKCRLSKRDMRKSSPFIMLYFSYVNSISQSSFCPSYVIRKIKTLYSSSCVSLFWARISPDKWTCIVIFLRQKKTRPVANVLHPSIHPSIIYTA